ALPIYLAAKGYYSKAFYAVNGTFFNAEKAFRFYGFDEFVDRNKLKLGGDWANLSDMDIVGSVAATGAFRRSGPFFYYILTMQNHGPHPCENFTPESVLQTTLAKNSNFALDCQLNEYLRRARSTSEAFLFVLNELKQIEAATGRPYVLIGYGDHQ